MAYVTPETRAGGYVVPHTVWNQDVVDNVVYLKTEADKLDDVNQLEPVREKDIIYQNTTGKIIFATIAITITSPSATRAGVVYCKNATPPTIVVGTYLRNAGEATNAGSISFVVPPGYYYKLGTGPSAEVTIASWLEWYLH